MAMYVRYGGVDFEVAQGPAVGVSDVAERIDAALSRPDSPWLAVRTTRGDGVDAARSRDPGCRHRRRTGGNVSR
jgi:hypothetical protein